MKPTVIQARTVGTQNVKRAAFLVATCLACAAVLIVSGYSGTKEIALTDQNEFESEPVSDFIKLNYAISRSDYLPSIKIAGMGCELGKCTNMCLLFFTTESNHCAGFGGIPASFRSNTENSGDHLFHHTMTHSF
jgi:hypothetical protein